MTLSGHEARAGIFARLVTDLALRTARARQVFGRLLSLIRSLTSRFALLALAKCPERRRTKLGLRLRLGLIKCSRSPSRARTYNNSVNSRVLYH